MAQNNNRQVCARVPEKLMEAVQDRAEALGVSSADVVRAGLAREVSAPPASSRLFLELWLSGQVEAPEPLESKV